MIQGLVCRKILMHLLQYRDLQNKLCICFIIISWKTVVKTNHEANLNYETHRRKYTEGSSLLEYYVVSWIKDFLAFQKIKVPSKLLEPLWATQISYVRCTSGYEPWHSPQHNGAFTVVLRTSVVVGHSSELSNSITLESQATMGHAANNEYSGVAHLITERRREMAAQYGSLTRHWHPAHAYCGGVLTPWCAAQRANSFRTPDTCGSNLSTFTWKNKMAALAFTNA